MHPAARCPRLARLSPVGPDRTGSASVYFNLHKRCFAMREDAHGFRLLLTAAYAAAPTFAACFSKKKRAAFVFSAKTHKGFLDGDAAKDIILPRVRRVPAIEIHTVDPETGRQPLLSDGGSPYDVTVNGAMRSAPSVRRTSRRCRRRRIARIGGGGPAVAGFFFGAPVPASVAWRREGRGRPGGGQLPEGALAETRRVLHDYGNMSAATVLFVLREALANSGRERMLLTAGTRLYCRLCDPGLQLKEPYCPKRDESSSLPHRASHMARRKPAPSTATRPSVFVLWLQPWISTICRTTSGISFVNTKNWPT
jgi:Chalcone and stilbene synthases, C-terminal domain